LRSRVVAEPGVHLTYEIQDSAMVIGMLKNRDLDAVVIVPPNFVAELTSVLEGSNAVMPPVIGLYADDTREKSGFAARRILGALESFRSETIEKSLASRGYSPDLVKLFNVNRQNVSSEEMGRYLAAMVLPYVIILMALTGAMYPAIDLTAGEKERGTLETLLVSGVARMDIVLGKFLTVFTASAVTSALTVGSLAASGAGVLGMSAEISRSLHFSIEPISIGLLILAMIPMCLIFSALLMTLGLFAKSYKEAQSYVSPLMIVVIVPAMMSLMPDTELSRQVAFIPILNASMLMKDALVGEIEMLSLIVTMAVNILLACGCLFLVLKMFKRETVLFRI